MATIKKESTFEKIEKIAQKIPSELKPLLIPSISTSVLSPIFLPLSLLLHALPLREIDESLKKHLTPPPVWEVFPALFGDAQTFPMHQIGVGEFKKLKQRQ